MIGDNEIDSMGDGNKLWKLNVLNPQTQVEKVTIEDIEVDLAGTNF